MLEALGCPDQLAGGTNGYASLRRHTLTIHHHAVEVVEGGGLALPDLEHSQRRQIYASFSIREHTGENQITVTITGVEHAVADLDRRQRGQFYPSLHASTPTLQNELLPVRETVRRHAQRGECRRVVDHERRRAGEGLGIVGRRVRAQRHGRQGRRV